MNVKKRLSNKANYGAKRSGIKYIVIHYTGNDGDSDEGNGSYFANNIVKASAHYFVDDDSITLSVPEDYTAWSVGGKKYPDCAKTGGGGFYGRCTNSNSISIELCDSVRNGKSDFTADTVTNAVELTKSLMRRYNIGTDRVIRHFDVTGKMCPLPYIDNAKWADFKRRLTETEETDMEELEKLKREFEEYRRQKDEIINRMGQEIAELKKPPAIYNYIDENMPEWAREAVGWFSQKGILKGDENGFNLTYTELRLYTAMYRAVRFICGIVNVKI